MQHVPLLLICASLALGSWAATVQPPPLIQTLSAGGDIGPEFKLDPAPSANGLEGMCIPEFPTTRA